LEAQIELIRREIERLREKSEQAVTVRLEDRATFAENVAAVRISMANLEGRLSSLENGMMRLMSHSTWLLRLIVGGLGLAAVNFAIKGGLAHGLA
jgi:hypothetical protein